MQRSGKSYSLKKPSLSLLKGVLCSEGGRFILRLALALACVFTLVTLMPQWLGEALKGLTAAGVVSFATAVGLSGSVEGQASVVIDGFLMRVILACTAVSYILIYVAAIVAYPASARSKLQGVAIGVVLVTFLNLARITGLGWLGAHYPAHFDFVHKFVWETAFLFVVVAVWVLWQKGWLRAPEDAADNHTGTFWRRTSAMALLVFIFMAGHIHIAAAYERFVATSCTLLLALFGFNDMVISGGGTLGLNFSVIGTAANWKVLVVSVFDIFLFASLSICFSRQSTPLRSAAVFAAGASAIFCVHTLAVVAKCLALSTVVPYDGLISAAETLVPFSPVLVWVLLNARTIIERGDRGFKGRWKIYGSDLYEGI